MINRKNETRNFLLLLIVLFKKYKAGGVKNGPKTFGSLKKPFNLKPKTKTSIPNNFPLLDTEIIPARMFIKPAKVQKNIKLLSKFLEYDIFFKYDAVIKKKKKRYMSIRKKRKSNK